MSKTAHASQNQRTKNSIKKWVEDLNRHFSKEDTETAHRHERMLSITNQRNANQDSSEVPPHNSRNGHGHPKHTNNTFWRGCGGDGAFLHCWWECRVEQSPQRIERRCLEKLRIELPYDTAIPFLGIYLEKTIIQKDTCIPVFTAALFTRAKTWNNSNIH